ncbi:enoyl-CoA hydratase/isomerase family protein [Aquibium carbonis]|uniref:Enoyl-CoA hydratase/isomerase family protein n=1 Tax=Aquibium carbonis TaxID=2495581 RepID=A0A3S0A5Q9_9HYPH|nr:enoyl-CoA hydratase/isomerase family protein [Aquibium carbonis]RST85381.1 enoyl-CoA hydratase/isomerase family protein [Aquibium carbonis]
MQELDCVREGGLLLLTLNVPGKKNALTDLLRAELQKAIADAQDDASVTAILLSGAAGSFSSGGDISAMTSDPKVARRRMAILHDIARLLIAGRKPSVAAVAGPAFGAGFSLALCCDAVIADTSAKFCASFGRIGLPPDLALGWTLPSRVPVAKARQLLLSGRVVEAEEAGALGIADEVVEPEALMETARRWAADLSANLPGPKGHLKALLALDTLDRVLAAEMEAYIACLASQEHISAREAFLSKGKTRT